MGDKCSNCGAELAKDSAFCPLCGTPRAAAPKPQQTQVPQAQQQAPPVQQPPQPVQQQPPQQQAPPTQVAPPPPPQKPPKAPKQKKVKPPKPPKPPKTGPSGIQGFINFAFTIKMMMIGVFITILIGWIARIAAQFTIGNLYKAMNVINFTFMAGTGIILLFGGILNSKLDKYLRIGLIIAGALILAANL